MVPLSSQRTHTGESALSRHLSWSLWKPYPPAPVPNTGQAVHAVMVMHVTRKDLILPGKTSFWCLQVHNAGNKLGRRCDMCSNYEKQLQGLQTQEAETRDQVSALGRPRAVVFAGGAEGVPFPFHLLSEAHPCRMCRDPVRSVT